MATARSPDRSWAATASSTCRVQIATTRCQDTPVNRATAANGISRHRLMTSASNNSEKPDRRPAQGGLTSATRPSGSLTRGTRASSTHSCWKKFRCRCRLTCVSWTGCLAPPCSKRLPRRKSTRMVSRFSASSKFRPLTYQGSDRPRAAVNRGLCMARLHKRPDGNGIVPHPGRSGAQGARPVDLCASPSDRPAPRGTWGRPVDNAAALTTARPHSRASRTHLHRTRHNCVYWKREDRSRVPAGCPKLRLIPT